MFEIFPSFAIVPSVFVRPRVARREVVPTAVEVERGQAAVKAAEEKIAGKGRVVLHPSGTEPLIRVWVSGSDAALVKELSDSIINEIKRFQ